jgi:C-terminal processing protease CtpA/Prc
MMEGIKEKCPQNFKVWVSFLMGMVVIIIAIVVFDSVLVRGRLGQIQENPREVTIETPVSSVNVEYVKTVSSTKDSDPEAWLGIEPMDIDSKMADQLDLSIKSGVLASRVVPGSPAEQAGILRGDILYEYEYRDIKDTDQLEKMIEKSDPGERVKISLFRQNDRMVIYVLLGERSATSDTSIRTISGDTSDQIQWGMVVTELMPQINSTYGIPPNEQGILVLKVISGSLADKAGVRKGDLVRSINNAPVYRMSDFFDALGFANNQLLLNILRQGSEFYITVTSSNKGSDSATNQQSSSVIVAAQEGIGMNRPLYVPGYDQTQSGEPDDKNTGNIVAF